MSAPCQHRGHANLLCIVPFLVYVLPKRAQYLGFSVKPERQFLINPTNLAWVPVIFQAWFYFPGATEGLYRWPVKGAERR